MSLVKILNPKFPPTDNWSILTIHNAFLFLMTTQSALQYSFCLSHSSMCSTFSMRRGNFCGSVSYPRSLWHAEWGRLELTDQLSGWRTNALTSVKPTVCKKCVIENVQHIIALCDCVCEGVNVACTVKYIDWSIRLKRYINSTAHLP